MMLLCNSYRDMKRKETRTSLDGAIDNIHGVVVLGARFCLSGCWPRAVRRPEAVSESITTFNLGTSFTGQIPNSVAIRLKWEPAG